MGDLRAALGPGEVPQVWEVVQDRVRCVRCGFAEVRWGVPAPADCPKCGTLLEPHTRLDLRNAPDAVPLAALGIPPREILPVLTAETGIRYAELRN